MLAFVATQDPPYATLTDAPEPEPAPSETLVAVHATSLNRGEVSRMRLRAPGTVVGWDVAGIVERRAADGSGPPAGARVVGLVQSGAWAQLAAVPARDLAEIPDQVSFEQAATLPVAAITALYALDLAGSLIGERVCITGASGGVGRFAIQLAHRAGAYVTGVVGSPERGEGLKELGADELITDFTPEGDHFDLILESVGGASLAAALGRVGWKGTVVAFGASSPEPTTFDISGFYNRGGPTLYGLRVFHELEFHGSGVRDLTFLVEELAAGRLDPQIGVTGRLWEPGDALQALIDRRVPGKAVLTA
jgi:NADPH:quinone reductase